MKKTITGWVYKNTKAGDILRFNYHTGRLDVGAYQEVYKKKGKKDFWGEEDWPPKKVIITIEVED